VRALKAAKASQAEVKAAVEAYIALADAQPKGETKTAAATGSQNSVEAAADKVRQLKAAKAPQAEVKAAVEAYIALTQGGSKDASAKTTTGSASTSTTAAPAAAGSVEAAADRVRQLKAAKAPQAEVKAAVDAYVALTQGGAASGQSAVERAADKVRSLKAAKAPQSEVKAAVEAYVALTQQSGGATAAAASAPAATETKAEARATETKTEQTDLDRAADKVRSLKAARAPQPEVRAAVQEFLIEEAKDNVRKLKAAKAPQSEVKAAVEKYIALTEKPAEKSAEPHAAAQATSSSGGAATTTAATTEPAAGAESGADEGVVRFHTGESS
jgi:hypothetical protein